jgi:hypothetical protein
MHQLCNLRFVLTMQAELPVKWNAFQTQKYTCACSSFNYEGCAVVLINLKNRNTCTNFWHDRCVTPRHSECTTQVRTEEKHTWKFANICFYGVVCFVSKQNNSVKVHFSCLEHALQMLLSSTLVLRIFTPIRHYTSYTFIVVAYLVAE